MIPTEIQNIFSFIDFLHSNIENFKQHDETVKEILNLDKERKRLDKNQNFEAKLKYDEIQSQLDNKFTLVQTEILTPIKDKAIELNICDFTDEPDYNWKGIEGIIFNFKREFSTDDVPIIQEHNAKYRLFKRAFIYDRFNSFFWSDLNRIVNEIFDYFIKPETEFEKFLKQFDSEAQFSDFENIVKQFSEKELEQKPPYIFEKLKEPYRVGNGNHLMVPYIPLNFFKDELELRLKKELVDRKEVIKYFRDTYIQKIITDSRYKSIYNNLKSGNETFVILQNQTDRWLHYTKVITVKELIKLELHLNELESEKTNAGEEPKQYEPPTNVNSCPKIFTDKGFQLWNHLFENFKIKESSQTDIKFCFEKMKKDSLIHDTVKQVDFLRWLNDVHNWSVQKPNSTVNLKDDKKLKLYDLSLASINS